MDKQIAALRYSDHRSRRHLDGCCTKTISVAEKQYTLAFALSTLARLNPLAPTGAAPHGLEKSEGTISGIGAVVTAHHLLDGLGGFVRVVKGNRGNVMVKNMRLDDAVEELATNESKLAVNGGSCATNICPRFRVVMRQSRVGVLKEGDGNYHEIR